RSIEPPLVRSLHCTAALFCHACHSLHKMGCRAAQNNRAIAEVIPCAANADEYIAPRSQRPFQGRMHYGPRARNGQCGEVAEWSKAHAWKVCRRGTVSRVRIPFSPPQT